MNMAKYIKNSLPVTLLAVWLMAILLTGCNDKDYDDSDVVPNPATIARIVSADSNFNSLRLALNRANLAATFESSGPFTVFAPTNAAFNAAGLSETVIASLDAATLAGVLQYHVINGTVKSMDIQNGINASTNTLNGNVFVSKFQYGTTTDGNNVSYGVSVNGSRVTRPDIVATNGIIHVVDAVILPPTQNLLTLITADTSFSLLSSAVAKAGIGSTLTAAGPITVFAPNNAAFRSTFTKEVESRTRNRSNAEVEAEILAPLTAAQLAGILTYHVVPGRVFSTNFTPTFVNTPGAIPVPGKVTTLSGGTVNISSDIRLTGNGNDEQASSIVKANVLTTNGVAHVINRVLLP
jgi:uncharacterized surface protein with fasciclin (FAS1) repeats